MVPTNASCYLCRAGRYALRRLASAPQPQSLTDGGANADLVIDRRCCVGQASITTRGTSTGRYATAVAPEAARPGRQHRWRPPLSSAPRPFQAGGRGHLGITSSLPRGSGFPVDVPRRAEISWSTGVASTETGIPATDGDYLVFICVARTHRRHNMGSKDVWIMQVRRSAEHGVALDQRIRQRHREQHSKRASRDDFTTVLGRRLGAAGYVVYVSSETFPHDPHPRPGSPGYPPTGSGGHRLGARAAAWPPSLGDSADRRLAGGPVPASSSRTGAGRRRIRPPGARGAALEPPAPKVATLHWPGSLAGQPPCPPGLPDPIGSTVTLDGGSRVRQRRSRRPRPPGASRARLLRRSGPAGRRLGAAPRRGACERA